MEVHGVGLVEKIYDVASGVITAMKSCASISLEHTVLIAEAWPQDHGQDDAGRPARELLRDLDLLIRNFRGGDHPYASSFAAALNTLPGYRDP